MHLRRHTADLSTRLVRTEVEQLIRQHVNPGKEPRLTSESLGLFPNLNARARRTRPLGAVFEEKHDIFKGTAWRSDRSGLIYGVLNWTIFLWNTEWMSHLCCYGLEVEKDVLEMGCMQFLAQRKCLEVNCRNQATRLEALGIVLAELLLATPIQVLRKDGKAPSGPPYELWDGKHKKPCYMIDIANDVRAKTNSVELAQVVRFCLEDESALATEDFRPEFISGPWKRHTNR
jgi:hypothetical protein